MSEELDRGEEICDRERILGIVRRVAEHIARNPAGWKGEVLRIRRALSLNLDRAFPERPTFIRTLGGAEASFAMSDFAFEGAGGLNRVFRAEDLSTDTPVAVRYMVPARTDAEEKRRSERIPVLEHLQSLRHPHLARLYGLGLAPDPQSGVEDEHIVEVYDYICGEPLLTWIARHGMTLRTFRTLAAQQTDVLNYLHENDIIHGDVKPENFFMPRGEGSTHLKLIDPDLICTPEQVLRSYEPGRPLAGTPSHLPPESYIRAVDDITQEELIRFATSKDVYALGITFHQMLTGELPLAYVTNSLQTMRARKVAGDDPDFTFTARVPFGVQCLVRAMCAHNWRERPTLDEVAAFLPTLSDGTENLVHPSYLLYLRDVAAEPSLEPLRQIDCYRVLDELFGKTEFEGKTVPLLKLQDARGSAFVAVPASFTSEEDAEMFFAERSRLLSELDRVRKQHPTLFSGGFCDMVRMYDEPSYRVFIVRPYLDGLQDLPAFLAATPDFGLQARLMVLRRTAESLAVLQQAGYVCNSLTAEAICFIPHPDNFGSDPFGTNPTLLYESEYDIEDGAGRRYRQELMKMISFSKRVEDHHGDPSVADFLRIASSMGVLDIHMEEMIGIYNLPDWEARAEALRAMEAST